MHMAVRDRDIDAVRALLEHGAAVDIEDRGRKSTPLRRAVANTSRPGPSGRQDVAGEISRAAGAYAKEVTDRRFPAPEHCAGVEQKTGKAAPEGRAA